MTTGQRLSLIVAFLLTSLGILALIMGAMSDDTPPGREDRARMIEPGVVEWYSVPPCLSDDGEIPDGEVGCYWDGSRMGNGEGMSFTAWAW